MRGFKNQEDLAEAIGADQPTVARWETDTYFPSEEYISKLKKFLQVNDDFFYEQDWQMALNEEAARTDITEASLLDRIERLERKLKGYDGPNQGKRRELLVLIDRLDDDQIDDLLIAARALLGDAALDDSKSLSKRRSK